MTKQELEEIYDKAYKLISESRDGLVQSELWKKLNVSSRKGSQIVKELVKRDLIGRRRVLYNGRWTYKLFTKKRQTEIDLIEDLYCLKCPYEGKCSREDVRYLIRCTYIEGWALRKYKVMGEKSEEK